jgi:hypothetical protein
MWMNRGSFFSGCCGGSKVATVDVRLRISKEGRHLPHPVRVCDDICVNYIPGEGFLNHDR